MFSRLISFALALFILGCNANNRETRENRSDDGYLERYECDKKSLLKDGLYQKFRPDGKLFVEATYKMDSLHGVRKYFHENGALESVENFVEGKHHGSFKAYYASGKPKVDQSYVKGAMQGWSTVWYENGNIREKVMMKDNEENGPFFEYWENGNIQFEGSYIPAEDDGPPLEQGELKEYDENGQLVRIAQCVKGMCSTSWKKQE